MTKDILLEKVQEKEIHSRQTLLSWVRALPNDSEKRKPVEYKQGDVLMHVMFRHPYVLLRKLKSGGWVCGLLTTEAGCPEILEACQSRFFSESYFTKTLFTTTELKGSFLNNYDNTKHIRLVHKQLKELLNK